MKAFFDQRQKNHDPQFRLKDGKVVENPDRPARVALLQSGAEAAGCTFYPSTDHGLAPLGRVHTPRYLAYLRGVHARRAAQVAGLSEVVPGRSSPDHLTAHYSYEAEAQIGYHNADTSSPISATTWEAVYWSAQTAVSAAEDVLAGARCAYALSRPSGHHAFREVSGGFCFVNNSAVAAEHLRVAGHRPAILDIDVHHGNGTQGIFYERDDVFTASLHVDPAQFYPFYAGGAQEAGAGQGLGYNLNLPLPRGTENAAYLSALERALEQIECFGASVIVVALGLDAHESDPFRGMAITTEGFGDIARAIRALGLPMLLVQEGGYMQPALSDNLASFLRAAEGDQDMSG